MTSDLWTSRHSLNSILCLIGNQCNSRRAEDTWSRGRRSMTTRAAACSTRCNVCVCVSDTFVHSVKTGKHIVRLFSP